jgi:hypothetical protein
VNRLSLPNQTDLRRKNMKKLLFVSLSALLLLSTFFAGSASSAIAKEPKILEFDTMVGVPRPYTGTTNAIRGVPGGGLPWVISSGFGELKANGDVEVTVQGLVIDPNDPAAIAAGVAGRNPANAFKVIVSCLSKDAGGNATTINLSSQTFPATTGLASEGGGNSKIEAHLDLPQPCIAPIIFVTSGGGNWFAATGF